MKRLFVLTGLILALTSCSNSVRLYDSSYSVQGQELAEKQAAMSTATNHVTLSYICENKSDLKVTFKGGKVDLLIRGFVGENYELTRFAKDNYIDDDHSTTISLNGRNLILSQSDYITYCSQYETSDEKEARLKKEREEALNPKPKVSYQYEGSSAVLSPDLLQLIKDSSERAKEIESNTPKIDSVAYSKPSKSESTHSKTSVNNAETKYSDADKHNNSDLGSNKEVIVNKPEKEIKENKVAPSLHFSTNKKDFNPNRFVDNKQFMASKKAEMNNLTQEIKSLIVNNYDFEAAKEKLLEVKDIIKSVIDVDDSNADVKYLKHEANKAYRVYKGALSAYQLKGKDGVKAFFKK